MKRIVVAGGTGMVGRELLALLSGRDGAVTTALVRRPSGLGVPQRIEERVVDFDDPKTYDLACDALFCCVGTTMKAAGSKAAFRKVDHDIPVRLIAGLKRTSPAAVFGLVSSVGADAPTGFYLQVKNEVEQALQASGLRSVVIRPSVLLGDRREVRPGERAAMIVMPPLFGLLGALTGKKLAVIGKYQPAAAAAVARSLVRAALDGAAVPWQVLEGYAIL